MSLQVLVTVRHKTVKWLVQTDESPWNERSEGCTIRLAGSATKGCAKDFLLFLAQRGTLFDDDSQLATPVCSRIFLVMAPCNDQRRFSCHSSCRRNCANFFQERRGPREHHQPAGIGSRCDFGSQPHRCGRTDCDHSWRTSHRGTAAGRTIACHSPAVWLGGGRVCGAG